MAGLVQPEPYLEPKLQSTEDATTDEDPSSVPGPQRETGIEGADSALKPPPGSTYADLGDVEPVNLLSFAYQIASGMVGCDSSQLCCYSLAVYSGQPIIRPPSLLRPHIQVPMSPPH